MIDPGQFTACVIRPGLESIGMYSPAGAQLLLGTACAESQLGSYLVQVGGPALGVFQMEPATHDDIWRNYIRFRMDLQLQVRRLIPPLSSLAPGQPPSTDLLVTDLRYAAAMARLVYRRSPLPLPPAGDWDGMAAMWKRDYNTTAGKGTIAHFMASLEHCGIDQAG